MNRKQKITIARIAISVLIFILLMVVATRGELRLVLFLVPYFIVGYDVLWGAVTDILKGKMLGEKFLMSIATLGAICLQEYPEALAVMLFYQIGELFMDLAVDRSKRSIAELMDICPDHAVVIRDDSELKVEPFEVAVDEIIIVKPGEKIPLDGIITEGESALDTTALTGESTPRDCTVGDSVVSGSVNQSGLLKIKVTASYENSTVSKILELVESASNKKAKAENFITAFAKVYTPIVVACAVLLAVIPSLFAGDWVEWSHRALIFLVVSCPCALVISVPLTFFGGIGAAARHGILVKGSNYLEKLAKANTVVFDKTGTLTYGRFEVTEVVPENTDKKTLIRLAATAESYSNHPIAKSICREYIMTPDKAEKVTELAGKGIIADGIACGNAELMKDIGITPPEADTTATVVHVALDRVYKGYILISDAVKEGAPEAVSVLYALGIERTVMLTGDRTSVAEAVGNEVGIEERYSNLLPDQKVAKLEEILSDKKGKECVCYVGDGINDAPVLACADVGIAMGALGSDAAIEAADIVLMDDAPQKVALAVDIARFTSHIARQNVIMAISVKLIVLLLSAFGLAEMWMAVFADVGVAVLATLNAMRTLKG